MDPTPNGARQPLSLGQRLLVVALAAPIFLGLLPFLLIRGGAFLDRALGLPRLALGPVNFLLGGIGILGGLLFALWSIQLQLVEGQGTPAPMVPTQRLLTDGPYAYCRNPMALGTSVAYAGLAIWIGSLGALGLVILFTALLVFYIRAVEEKELAARFGPAYLDYARRTPRFFPRLRRAEPTQRSHP